MAPKAKATSDLKPNDALVLEQERDETGAQAKCLSRSFAEGQSNDWGHVRGPSTRLDS